MNHSRNSLGVPSRERTSRYLGPLCAGLVGVVAAASIAGGTAAAADGGPTIDTTAQAVGAPAAGASMDRGLPLTDQFVDLALSVTAPGSVVEGETYDYTFDVTNLGGADVNPNLVTFFRATVFDGQSFVGPAPAGCEIYGSGDGMDCYLDSGLLGAGETITFHLAAVVDDLESLFPANTPGVVGWVDTPQDPHKLVCPGQEADAGKWRNNVICHENTAGSSFRFERPTTNRIVSKHEG